MTIRTTTITTTTTDKPVNNPQTAKPITTTAKTAFNLVTNH